MAFQCDWRHGEVNVDGDISMKIDADLVADGRTLHRPETGPRVLDPRRQMAVAVSRAGSTLL